MFKSDNGAQDLVAAQPMAEKSRRCSRRARSGYRRFRTVQARLRHATASTTLDIYGHLWPDADESTRTVIGAVIRNRLAATADALRTNGPTL